MWSDKVSDSQTRYPIIGLQQDSMKTTICTSMGLFQCILLYHWSSQLIHQHLPLHRDVQHSSHRSHSHQTELAWELELDDTSFGNINFPHSPRLPARCLSIDLAVTTFAHYQNRPKQSPGHRYDERSTQEWCECMDSLLVSWILCLNTSDTYCLQSKLTCVMGSELAHQEIVTTVIWLCSDSITQFEGILNAVTGSLADSEARTLYSLVSQ